MESPLTPSLLRLAIDTAIRGDTMTFYAERDWEPGEGFPGYSVRSTGDLLPDYKIIECDPFDLVAYLVDAGVGKSLPIPVRRL
jgi:hypothetical protein